MKELLTFILIVSWMVGTVLASSWLKLIAALLPPYAWYLTVEWVMKGGWA